MPAPLSFARVLSAHVTLEVECIDRLFLNVYVPRLQWELGVACFFRYHRGLTVPSSALMQPISDMFRRGIATFAERHGIPVLCLAGGQDKDQLAAWHRKRLHDTEGVLFIGKAREKTTVFQTEKRRNVDTGLAYPWIVRATAVVGHHYFYCVDEDFGPFFLKFCSHFPYNARLCINGHEYVKCQLAREGIAFEALDNGIRQCTDPKRLQELCNSLSAERIDALLRKWLARLPHPFSAEDQAAGYCYEVSISQAEFALTQVLDRPLTGRIFLEEMIRENLDIGRPDQIQLILQRRVTRRTPGRFRTRVLTDGVTPTLHVHYKHSRIKQYHKEGRALRTETTINNSHDFGIGKRLHNLDALRTIGFQANRRLLEVERLSHDCALGDEAFRRVTETIKVNGQRAAALHYGDPCVQAVLSCLSMFRLLPRGFSSRELRAHLGPLLGKAPNELTLGRMTYELRRLRLHGLIERQAGTHRYRVTDFGLRTSLFFTRSYARILRTGMAQLTAEIAPEGSALRRAFDRLEAAMDRHVGQARLGRT